MSASAWKLRVEVWRGQELVAEEAANLSSCSEDAIFRGVVEGRLPNTGAVPVFELAPRFRDAGRGIADGLALHSGDAPAGCYTREVFAPQARFLIAELLASGALASGDPIEWRLSARREHATAAGPEASVVRAPLPLQAAVLADAEARSFRVEVSGELLEAVRAKIVGAGALEYAALLVGRLLHDADRGACVLRVTGCIDLEAGEGGRSHTHFALGADSFTSGLRALRESGSQAIVAGWLHSHPACPDCPSNPTCPVHTVFFSAKDVAVHAVAFAPAHNVGLVGGKLGDEPATRPGFRLYGWEQGRVSSRPFSVIDHPREEI